mgnify:CR=1 FL=1
MPPVVLAVAAVVAYSAAYYYVAAALFVAAVAMASPDVPDYDNESANPLAAQELSTTANQPRKVIYGETVVGGQIIGYRKLEQGETEYHYFAIHIAGHPCESVEVYEIDGVTPAEFGGAVGAVFHLGDQTTAHAQAVQYIQDWTTEHVGFGLTNAYVKVKIDPEIFPTGVNQIKFKVRGKPVYDPRKDTTAGGEGEQRATDSSTWAWSDNPILCTYDYIRNYGYRPIPLRRIPWDFAALTANYCDTVVEYTDTNGDTQSERRFTCNGVINSTLKPGDSLKYLLSSSGARIYRPGGKIYIKPAMYGGPSTVTLTPDDFVEQPNYQPHRPEKEKTNLVRGEYVEPDLKYQVTDAPVTFGANYAQDDGTELDSNLKLYFTNRSTIAQRLQKRQLERSQAGFTSQVSLQGIRLDVVPGAVLRYVDTQTGVDREFIVQDYRVDVSKRRTILAIEEEHIELYQDDFTITEINIPANTSLPDTTNISPVENINYTPTPNDSHRQGFLTWSHPTPSSVRRYIALLVRIPDDGWYHSETPLSPTLDVKNLAAGNYSALISAENRFDKRSVAPVFSFNVGLPSTPTNTPLKFDILPGRVIIVGPELPNSSATYEWRYSFTDDFDSALIAADGTGVTIVGTRQDDTLYLWYRLKEGDLVDPNWIQLVIPHLIGLTSDEIRPDVIAGITLPSLPNTLLDTISGFSQWLNDQDYYNEELEAGQISLFEDIQMVNDALAIVDEKTTTVGVEVGLVSAKVAQAFRAISSDRMSRAILESKLQSQFGDLSSVYLKTVDLYTSAGAARASDLTQLGVTVGNVNAKAESNLILIAEEEAARISDINERRIATEAVDAKAVNSLQLIADEEQARIEDIEQRRLATEAVDAKADNSLELIATEKQARIDDIETRRVATAAVDAKADNALQLIADEEQARIDDIEQRRVATEAVDAKAVSALSLIATETQARIDDIEQRRVATVDATAKADNALSLIADEEDARIQLGQQLTTTFNNSLASYVKQSELFSGAGAARASDLNTVSARVGNSSVASQITSFKNAQIGYENGSGNWVQGAAFAQAFSEVKITGSLGNNLSIYSYFEAIEDELGQVSGEIQFAVNNDGRITGVFVKGSSTQSVLTFVGNSIRIVATNGTTLMSVNASTNRMTIYADGEFTGNLRSASMDTIGTNFMEVKRPSGFGSQGLWYWYGPKSLTSGGDPNLNYCTKANASIWYDTTGGSYFGGGLSGGAFYAAMTSSVKTLNPEVRTGVFSTNGNSKKVVVTFSRDARKRDYNFSGSLASKSVSIKARIHRAVGGSESFSAIGSLVTFNGTVTYEDQRGDGLGVLSVETLDGSYTYVDSDSRTSDFEYKIVTSNQTTEHTTAQVTQQLLSVVSTEV